MAARVGIVGAGSIAQRHADVLARAEAQVVGVVGRNELRAAALAERTGAALFSSVGALVAAQVDALWICTPPGGRAEAEAAAVQGRVPFLVEKPLTLDLPAAERVAQEVAAAGLPTAVGYHWRCLDSVLHARRLLGAERPRLLVGQWHGGMPEAPWWRRRAESGGQLVEQATHLLDLFRVLLGEPTWAGAQHVPPSPAERETSDVERASTAVLRFRGGELATLSTSCVLDRDGPVDVAVHTRSDVLRITQTQLEVVSRTGTATWPGRTDPLLRQAQDFLHVVGGGSSSRLADYAEGLRTHRLAMALAG